MEEGSAGATEKTPGKKGAGEGGRHLLVAILAPTDYKNKSLITIRS
jgi:hypothetical protein